jgi:hypothetical protein
VTAEERLAFLGRVAHLDSYGPGCVVIHWMPSADKSDLIPCADCGDVFYWGCADHEEVTQENFADLQRACADADAAGSSADAGGLFAARIRGMRPQGAVYRTITPAMGELYDACGPVRTDQDGAAGREPQKQPEAAQ